jgi:choline dehydrogenase-like flavoprotein
MSPPPLFWFARAFRFSWVFLEITGSAGGPILMPEAVDVDVLVVGAGPVGLTLAIDLAWRGVNVTVVEARAAAEPPEPKCNHVAARTMEIFRRLGLAEKIRNSGLPADYPHDISYRTTFTGQELTRIPIPCRRDRFTRKDGPDCNWPTPEPPHRITRYFSSPSCSSMPWPRGIFVSSTAHRPKR